MATLDKQDLVLNFTSMDDLNEFISKLGEVELRDDLICLRNDITTGKVSFSDWQCIGLLPMEVKIVEGLLNA